MNELEAVHEAVHEGLCWQGYVAAFLWVIYAAVISVLIDRSRRR